MLTTSMNPKRDTVRESLTVHPLLSTPAGSATSDSAKYVPYTPRQRPSTSSSQGSVSAKPQLANLRAAAQSIGLEANSVGWAILEKISLESDTSDEWFEIWHSLTKAKATLLLPSEPVAVQDSITLDLVQDHIIWCDREKTAVVSLSGLRGNLVNDTITFRSSLHRSTKPFQRFLAPSLSPAASLDALPPLPAYPLESSYPSFTVSAFSSSMPLPSKVSRPPLPPRPGVRVPQTASSARLSMPFASLFGQRPSTPPPSLHPTTTATTVHPSSDIDPVIDISAFVVDSALSRTDIATGIINALKGEIAIALNDYPPWLVERVQTFSLPFFPFVKVPAGKKKLQDIGGNPNRVVYAVNGFIDEPEELSQKFQAFYRTVEAELRNGGHRRMEDGDGLDTNGPQDLELPEESKPEANEVQIRDDLETIEFTLCTLLYDRLFLLSTSDDASHNEALSSRIAALNMLDLALEHLDVDIDDANYAEVDAVVRTCGQTLAQLDSLARSPREKSAVLVSAHKLVVEGLSTIPPVRLKSRNNSDKDPTNLTKHTCTSTATVNSIRISPSLEPTEKRSSSIPTVHLAISPDQSPTIEPTSVSEAAPSSTSSPVSGDVLLPILIFSVVKANPHRLVSHLLYTQRFRNQSFGGEESYCLINLMAVAEFLENVDLGALGLGEGEKKVISTADLTPIPIVRPNLPASPIVSILPDEEHPASLRGRVGQGVDAFAGSANKVISGVVDSSFGVLRALLPSQTVPVQTNNGGETGTVSGQPRPVLSVTSGSAGAVGETDTAALWNVRPSLGLLRRETGFSIAGLTAALPGGHARAKSQGHSEEGQRELVQVLSGPPSLRSHQSGREEDGSEGSTEEGSVRQSEDEDGVKAGRGDDAAEDEEDVEGEAEEGAADEEDEVHDTRSIKSFESMLSSGRTKRKTSALSTVAASSRRRQRLTDLTDRLTHGMAGMSRRVQGGDSVRRLGGQLPPPNRRFMECTEQDIRVCEVGDLLREYQRLVEAVRSAGGFQE